MRIRQVKREIRVLGIAVEPAGGDLLHVVGAIFRGGLWLDGVLRARAVHADLTERAVEMIRASPHHPQIRVVLLRAAPDAGLSIDPYRLSVGVSRPVIVLGEGGEGMDAPEPSGGPSGQRFEMEFGGKTFVVLSVGLPSRDAARVLEVSTRGEAIPEALRVSALVASAVAALPEQKV